MWQARKGASTLFRADRRYASSLKAITLTADAFFTLEYAVSAPTMFRIDKQLSIKTHSIIKIAELHALNYFYSLEPQLKGMLESEIIYLINPFASHVFSEDFLARTFCYSFAYPKFILGTKALFDFNTEFIREVACFIDAHFPFLTQVILPIIPSAATYSALLKCKAISKLDALSSETVSFLYGAEGKQLLERCCECLLFNCIDLEYLRILTFSIHLKSGTIAALFPIFSETLWMKLLAEIYLPGLYSLIAEIPFQHLFAYSIYIKESYMRELLIDAIATIGVFAPFIFTALIKWTVSASSSFHSIISKILKINYSFLSAFLSTINQNLMFKVLFEKKTAHELIGNILVLLKPSSPFSFFSDFSATLLAYLTSSLPIFVPPLPFGKLSFMDLSRIYNYQISDLRRVRKILIEW